ncbi:MAG TPA: hypothetical protein VGM31_07470, partial [Puia sp.]
IVAKDIHQIWTVFVSLLLFLSPVFYKLEVFKHALPAFDYANPIAGIIINARNVMMDHKPPSFPLLFVDYIYAIILLILGLFLLNQLGSKAAEKL